MLTKEEGYDIKFFMQVMQDGIIDCSELKNDYLYSVILRPIHERRNYAELFDWIENKFDELKSFISSLHKLSDAFTQFYKDNDDESDLRGLYYVASTYAEFYANLLKWGISVKGIFVPKECEGLMTLLSDMPSSIISEMEKYPKEAMEKIPRCIEKIRSGTVEKGDMILFPFEIDIPESIAIKYKQELDKLSEQVKSKKSKSNKNTNEQECELGKT